MDTSKQGHNRLTLFAICVASFLTPFSSSTIYIITPELGAYFNANAVLLAWLNTTFFLGAGIVLMPTAKLCDIFGRRRIYSIGVAGFGLFSFLAAMSCSIWMLLSFRFLQGMCGAFIVGPSMALITAITPGTHRGRALSTVVGAVYLGTAVGPFVGGWLSHYCGWRSVFVLFGLLALVSFVFTKLFIKGEWKTSASMKEFDYRGTLMYTIGIAALMLGATHLPGVRPFWITLAGIMALLAFIKIERETEFPVFDTSIFTKYLGFSFSSGAALLHYAAVTANMLLLSLYLQYIFGYDAYHAGILLLPQPISMLISTVIAGRLADRINPSYLATLGAICALGSSLMLGLAAAPTLQYIMGCQILVGCGYGFFVSPNTALIMGSVTPNRYNEASSVLGTMRLLGQVFSMGIISMVFAIVIGRVEITPAVYGAFVRSFKVGYILFAVLCLGVLMLSLPWKFRRQNFKQSKLVSPDKNKD